MNLTPAALKKVRAELELSQFDVSKAAKVSRYNISLFENGHRKFSKREEESIKNALTKIGASHGISN